MEGSSKKHRSQLATIGHLHWVGCTDCRFSDPEEGGCAVDDQEWRDGLEPDFDSILCGCFEARPENEAPCHD